MKYIQNYNEFLNEKLNESVNIVITPKDWDRMLDLIVSGKDDSVVAKLINKKDKAIARFVAGLKLIDFPFPSDKDLRGNVFNSEFSDLGNKAILLGATVDEIKDVFDKTILPQKYIAKLNNLKTKKLDSYAAPISKVILDQGFDITYKKSNGHAITTGGAETMYKNGRKWTIGYFAEIDLGLEKINFNFDAVTDEGGGPTYYFIDTEDSDNLFKTSYKMYKMYGKNEIVTTLKSIFQNYKKSKSII